MISLASNFGCISLVDSIQLMFFTCSFPFEVYCMFTPNDVNIYVRLIGTTLGEAKRILVHPGVLEEMLELELFRFQDESDD